MEIKKLLIVDEKGHCEGINEYGIGIVFATLKPYPSVKYADSDSIARDILNQKDIDKAITIIKNSQISVNIIISDGEKSFIIEKTPFDFAMTKIREKGTITNLSIKLDKRNGSLDEESRKSAKMRYQRAKKIINTIKSFEDISKFLSDKEGYPLYSICRGQESVSPTRCSFIYDLQNKKIFFCDKSPDIGTFKEYSFSFS